MESDHHFSYDQIAMILLMSLLSLDVQLVLQFHLFLRL